MNLRFLIKGAELTVIYPDKTHDRTTVIRRDTRLIETTHGTFQLQDGEWRIDKTDRFFVDHNARLLLFKLPEDHESKKLAR